MYALVKYVSLDLECNQIIMKTKVLLPQGYATMAILLSSISLLAPNDFFNKIIWFSRL